MPRAATRQALGRADWHTQSVPRAETNWAGNYTFAAAAVRRPSTVEEVREIVAAARQVHVLGSRHSFHGLADAPDLVALDALPADVVVDPSSRGVSCSAGLTYAALATALAARGLALPNLASHAHFTIAGAVATATHGSGDGSGNLATAVAGLELVTSDGEVVRASRGDPDFEGLVVGLGALGAVTRVTLDVEPAYEMRQRVFEGLAWDAFLGHLDQVMGAGTSVSVFTSWGEPIEQVWVKSRVTDGPEEGRGDLFGAAAATVQRHPVLGVDPADCSPQLGRPGPWFDRLPHFRAAFRPPGGDQLQSEYLVPRRHGRAALSAVRRMAGAIRPVLQVAEIRTVAADRLWLSPQYAEDTVALHFSWTLDQAAVERALVSLEAALAPFQARPHWGKLFLAGAPELARLYERLPDFRMLARRLDPRGAFRNRWLDTHVLS
jgi:xylitol oxidase